MGRLVGTDGGAGALVEMSSSLESPPSSSLSSDESSPPFSYGLVSPPSAVESVPLVPLVLLPPVESQP